MFYKIVTERTYTPLKNYITTFQRLLRTVLVNFSQSTNFLTLNTPGNCMLNNLWLNLFEQLNYSKCFCSFKIADKESYPGSRRHQVKNNEMNWNTNLLIWSVACENTWLTFYVQYDFGKASVFWDQNAHVHTEDELTKSKLQIEWKFNSYNVSKRLPQKLRRILCKKNIATVSPINVIKTINVRFCC